MKTHATGAALAGLGILLVAADAASAAPAADAASHSIVTLETRSSAPAVQTEISVSSAQLAAYTTLSSSLRDKHGGADTHVALEVPRHTIMCPW